MKGIGCDIIEIERVANAYRHHGPAFLKKILTEKEQAYCLSKSGPERHVAGRFAAKEAIAKALGCGFGDQLSFLDIEISQDRLGKPQVHLSSAAAEHFNHPEIHITLSHCKAYATAFAVIL